MQLNSMTCFGWKIYIFYGFLSTIMSKKEGEHDLTSSEVHAASQKRSSRFCSHDVPILDSLVDLSLFLMFSIRHL